MILILGPMADPVIAHQVLLLLERKAQFLVLDPRTFGTEWTLNWSHDEQGRLHGRLGLGPETIELSTVRLIWAHNVFPLEPRQDDVVPDAFVTDGRTLALTAFADVFPGTVINRPCRSYANGSKPYQQQRIAEVGFDPIQTLVTNDPQRAREFYAACSGQVIFKSMSWHRSVVRRMTPDDFAELDRLRNCPTQFQEYILGTDVRVHVVGRRAIATEIETSAEDYRYLGESAERVMRAIGLPVAVRDRCVKLAEVFDLPVCGIDLRRTPAGDYRCFEVNPCPDYRFYEFQSGQPIGDTIADWICSQ